MKKTARCLRYMLIAMCMMVVMTGCGVRERSEKAARLLEAKYGEKFIIDEYRGYPAKKPTQDYYTVIAHSEEYPTILCSARIGDDDTISDTYVCERLMARMSAEMSKSLEILKGPRYIFMQPVRKSPHLLNDLGYNVMRAFTPYATINDPNTSLETFLKEDPEQEIFVYVGYVPQKDETAEDLYDGITAMITSMGSAHGYVGVYICDDKSLGEMRTYVEGHDVLYRDYDKLTRDRLAGYIRYENGKLIDAKSDFVESARKLL